MSLASPPQYEPIRIHLGQIACTDTRVHTPVGSYPLAGTTWTVTNQSYVTESIPGWAIVLAIIFFIFCLLGLLFLLVKERRTSGSVQVSVQGPGFAYSSLIPAYNEMAIYQVTERVNWIRAQVARLPQA
jgi:sensor histidine kinase YesM